VVNAFAQWCGSLLPVMLARTGGCRRTSTRLGGFFFFLTTSTPRHPRTNCVWERARVRERDTMSKRERERERVCALLPLAIWWCMYVSSPSYVVCGRESERERQRVGESRREREKERKSLRTISVGYLVVHACLVTHVRIVCVLQHLLQCVCVRARVRA